MPQKNLSACDYLNGLLASAQRTALVLAILCLLCACTPSGGLDVPASAPATPVTQVTMPATQAAAPAKPEARLCSLGEMSASMEWQRSSGGLDARLVLANFGSQVCIVQGVPQIELVNQNGWKLPVDQVQNNAGQPPAKVTLDPAAAYTTQARFVWRNWCTPASEENLHLEVSLPGYFGKLNVPVQDPNGHYLTDTPHCDDPSAPSTLTIEAFK
jgi:hypothetical protein